MSTTEQQEVNVQNDQVVTNEAFVEDIVNQQQHTQGMRNMEK